MEYKAQKKADILSLMKEIRRLNLMRDGLEKDIVKMEDLKTKLAGSIYQTVEAIYYKMRAIKKKI